MTEPTARMTLEAGLAVRGPVRRACLALGLKYEEEKGWLDSFFVVSGPLGAMTQFRDWAQSVKEDAA